MIPNQNPTPNPNLHSMDGGGDQTQEQEQDEDEDEDGDGDENADGDEDGHGWRRDLLGMELWYPLPSRVNVVELVPVPRVQPVQQRRRPHVVLPVQF